MPRLLLAFAGTGIRAHNSASSLATLDLQTNRHYPVLFLHLSDDESFDLPHLFERGLDPNKPAIILQHEEYCIYSKSKEDEWQFYSCNTQEIQQLLDDLPVRIESTTPIESASVCEYLNTHNFHYERDEDYIQITFSGCQNSNIGGKSLGIGYINPNLDIVAQSLRSCFQNNQLDFTRLRNTFGQSILITTSRQTTQPCIIDSIAMLGFSRGAVTTFAVARALTDLPIPLHICASNPVPGDSDWFAATAMYSEYQKNSDLSGCTHLKTLHILLGACSKGMNSAHNTYFKEMTPTVPATCRADFFLIPRRHHNDFANFRYTAMHQSAFLHEIDYARVINFAPDDEETIFFTPKIIRQNFHKGTVGRTQVSYYIKQELVRQLQTFEFQIYEHDSYKKMQALLVLLQAPGKTGYGLLGDMILKDDSAQGIATREFIIEFENILRYAIRDPMQESMCSFRQRVFEQIKTYVAQPTSTSTNQLKTRIIESISSMSAISFKERHELLTLLSVFFEKNSLFHLELTSFLHDEEQENFLINETTAHQRALDQVDLNALDDADDMAQQLYMLSFHSKDKQKKSHTIILQRMPHGVHSLDDLKKVLSFFTPRNMRKLFVENPEFFAFIHSIKELNQLMNTLFTQDQRKALYHLCQPHYHEWIKASHVSDVDAFKQYFSIKKQSEIDRLIVQNPMRMPSKKLRETKTLGPSLSYRTHSMGAESKGIPLRRAYSENALSQEASPRAVIHAQRPQTPAVDAHELLGFFAQPRRQTRLSPPSPASELRPRPPTPKF